MKKLLSLLLSCILLLSLIPAASAEPNVTVLDARGATLDPLSNCLIVRQEREGACELLDPEGKTLVSADEGYLRITPDNGFFIAMRGDGERCTGLLAADGSLLIPAQYDHLEVLSDRWQVAFILSPSDESNYDFSYTDYNTNESGFSLIDRMDCYFDGALVGSLDRSVCNISRKAFGAYLGVKNFEGEVRFFDSSLTPSPYEASELREYDMQGGVYYHQGSGQPAFQPGCSLAASDVDASVKYIGGRLLDLQGNEVGSLPRTYSSCEDFEDGYAIVRANGSYGVISEDGREIIPPEYDEIGYCSYSASCLRLGFIGAEKDGMIGFLDDEGNVTVDFIYPADTTDLFGPFACVYDDDYNCTIVSAAVGELPGLYSSVRSSFYSEYGGKALIVDDLEGGRGAVDLYGNFIPCSPDHIRMGASLDGTLVLAQTPEQILLYRF